MIPSDSAACLQLSQTHTIVDSSAALFLRKRDLSQTHTMVDSSAALILRKRELSQTHTMVDSSAALYLRMRIVSEIHNGGFVYILNFQDEGVISDTYNGEGFVCRPFQTRYFRPGIIYLKPLPVFGIQKLMTINLNKEKFAYETR